MGSAWICRSSHLLFSRLSWTIGIHFYSSFPQLWGSWLCLQLLSAEICFVFISSQPCWAGAMRNARWLSSAHGQVWFIINIPASTTVTVFLQCRLRHAATDSMLHFEHSQLARFSPFRVSRQKWNPCPLYPPNWQGHIWVSLNGPSRTHCPTWSEGLMPSRP